MNIFKYAPRKSSLSLFKRNRCSKCEKHRHLICFKGWTADMILGIIGSAINLKRSVKDTHFKRLQQLNNAKIMILQEVNEPVLHLAVSKASTMLGAANVTITDQLVWEYDYLGRIFSMMSDLIFVSTATHECVQRFARQSTVPVICMRSRAHSSLQALATIMAIIEEFGCMKCLNVAYLGPPHPILNSYLLLCPLLGANIRFKCCCEKCPVSPLLLNKSQEISLVMHTVLKECIKKEDALEHACVVIAGPTHHHDHKVDEFRFGIQDIENNSYCHWIFFHTCPRGREIDDTLFTHNRTRTFNAFVNLQYIAAALMVNAIKGYQF